MEPSSSRTIAVASLAPVPRPTPAGPSENVGTVVVVGYGDGAVMKFVSTESRHRDLVERLWEAAVSDAVMNVQRNLSSSMAVMEQQAKARDESDRRMREREDQERHEREVQKAKEQFELDQAILLEVSLAELQEDEEKERRDRQLDYERAADHFFSELGAEKSEIDERERVRKEREAALRLKHEDMVRKYGEEAALWLSLATSDGLAAGESLEAEEGGGRSEITRAEHIAWRGLEDTDEIELRELHNYLPVKFNNLFQQLHYNEKRAREAVRTEWFTSFLWPEKMDHSGVNHLFLMCSRVEQFHRNSEEGDTQRRVQQAMERQAAWERTTVAQQFTFSAAQYFVRQERARLVLEDTCATERQQLVCAEQSERARVHLSTDAFNKSCSAEVVRPERVARDAVAAAFAIEGHITSEFLLAKAGDGMDQAVADEAKARQAIVDERVHDTERGFFHIFTSSLMFTLALYNQRLALEAAREEWSGPEGEGAISMRVSLLKLMQQEERARSRVFGLFRKQTAELFEDPVKREVVILALQGWSGVCRDPPKPMAPTNEGPREPPSDVSQADDASLHQNSNGPLSPGSHSHVSCSTDNIASARSTHSLAALHGGELLLPLVSKRESNRRALHALYRGADGFAPGMSGTPARSHLIGMRQPTGDKK